MTALPEAVLDHPDQPREGSPVVEFCARAVSPTRVGGPVWVVVLADVPVFTPLRLCARMGMWSLVALRFVTLVYRWKLKRRTSMSSLICLVSALRP